MLERFKYRAINAKGRQVKGVLGANSEIDLYNTLQGLGMELLWCASLEKKGVMGKLGNMGKKVKVRDLIQLFMNLEQMQSAGVPLLAALADIRDSSDHPALRDMMSEIHRNVLEGNSLSEALAQHPRVFTALYVSLIASGEETGDLTAIYLQLVKYLKWLDKMQTKIRKATRYPMVVCGVVVLTITIMMVVVVPQVVGFISGIGQEIPFYTSALMATSDFFVAYWWAVILGIIAFIVSIKVARRLSGEISFKLDVFALNAPVMGPLIRKISIARFAQTFGALYSCGVDVLRALDQSSQTVTNLALVEALDNIREAVSNGVPLSDAFNASGEFPSMVVRMLKVGEESGNLTYVLDQVSEFYTNDVDEAVEKLITMIEPSLTAILGGMILWIAAAIFGPIYSSFEKLDM